MLIRMLIDYAGLLKSPFPFEHYALRQRLSVHRKNLCFAFKGLLTRSNIKAGASNRKAGSTWEKFGKHLNFMLNYYDPKDFIFGPIIAYTATGVHWENPPYYDDIADSLAGKSLADVSAALHSLHEKVAREKWSQWLSCYVAYLEGGELQRFKLLELMREHNVLEIGPGIGAVMLWLRDLISEKKAVISYDLEQMQAVQRTLHERYEEFTGRELNFKYFTECSDLSAFLQHEEYVILSFHAFNEMPLVLRSQFEDLIELSVFSLFAANDSFDDVDNDEYFEKLGARLKGKRHYSFPVKLKDMKTFHEAHRIHLFIDRPPAEMIR